LPRHGAIPISPSDISAARFNVNGVKRSAAGHEQTVPLRPAKGGYYEHWLSALEKLVAAKGLADEAAIQVRKEEWAEAYRHTPHGQPVELHVGQEARRRK
jgi:hypothetical protein